MKIFYNICYFIVAVLAIIETHIEEIKNTNKSN